MKALPDRLRRPNIRLAAARGVFRDTFCSLQAALSSIDDLDARIVRMASCPIRTRFISPYPIPAPILREYLSYQDIGGQRLARSTFYDRRYLWALRQRHAMS